VSLATHSKGACRAARQATGRAGRLLHQACQAPCTAAAAARCMPLPAAARSLDFALHRHDAFLLVCPTLRALLSTSIERRAHAGHLGAFIAAFILGAFIAAPYPPHGLLHVWLPPQHLGASLMAGACRVLLRRLSVHTWRMCCWVRASAARLGSALDRRDARCIHALHFQAHVCCLPLELVSLATHGVHILHVLQQKPRITQHEIGQRAVPLHKRGAGGGCRHFQRGCTS